LHLIPDWKSSGSAKTLVESWLGLNSGCFVTLVRKAVSSMGVFDGKIKTSRSVADPGTDYKLPQLGSLSYGAIKSMTALAGTTGADACLIQGNKWQQVLGQHTENLTQDHKLTIMGNRQEMVTGNHTHTIVGNTNTTHVGVHNHTNIAPRNDVFAHMRTENHAEQEQKNQPTGRMENTASSHANSGEESHTKGEEHMAIGVKFEATGLSMESKGINVGVHGISSEAKLMKHHSDLLEDKMQAFVSEVVPAKIKVAAMHAKAVAASLNAGLAANADSPFA
jgi:hypothetical protein